MAGPFEQLLKLVFFAVCLCVLNPAASSMCFKVCICIFTCVCVCVRAHVRAQACLDGSAVHEV